MGLKLYLTLLIVGWEGFSEMVGYQTKLGQYLKKRLMENDWLILNDTPLPIICFTDERFKSDERFTKSIVQNIVESKKSWISNYPVNGISSIRVCISNYSSTENDVNQLVEELNIEREKYRIENEIQTPMKDKAYNLEI